MAKRAGIARLVGAALFGAGAILPASAAETYERLFRPLAQMAAPYLHRKTDFFSGIDFSDASAFAWMGVTYAPAGTLIEDGWRIRFTGGAGRYTYRTTIVPGGVNDANVQTAELLGGYRKTFDNILGQRVYVGAFVGLNHENQLLALPDPFNPTQGSATGAKAVLDLYARVSGHYILSGFASISTVHRKYQAKATLLHAWSPQWAFGIEAATMGDARYSENRAGLAASLTWNNRIISLSGGTLDNTGRGSGAYATLSVYAPF